MRNHARRPSRSAGVTSCWRIRACAGSLWRATSTSDQSRASVTTPQPPPPKSGLTENGTPRGEMSGRSSKTGIWLIAGMGAGGPKLTFKQPDEGCVIRPVVGQEKIDRRARGILHGSEFSITDEQPRVHAPPIHLVELP